MVSGRLSCIIVSLHLLSLWNGGVTIGALCAKFWALCKWIWNIQTELKWYLKHLIVQWFGSALLTDVASILKGANGWKGRGISDSNRTLVFAIFGQMICFPADSCNGNGQCIPQGTSGFQCNCNPGYQGLQCQVSDNSNEFVETSVYLWEQWRYYVCIHKCSQHIVIRYEICHWNTIQVLHFEWNKLYSKRFTHDYRVTQTVYYRIQSLKKVCLDRYT